MRIPIAIITDGRALLPEARTAARAASNADDGAHVIAILDSATNGLRATRATGAAARGSHTAVVVDPALGGGDDLLRALKANGAPRDDVAVVAARPGATSNTITGTLRETTRAPKTMVRTADQVAVPAAHVALPRRAYNAVRNAVSRPITAARAAVSAVGRGARAILGRAQAAAARLLGYVSRAATSVRDVLAGAARRIRSTVADAATAVKQKLGFAKAAPSNSEHVSKLLAMDAEATAARAAYVRQERRVQFAEKMRRDNQEFHRALDHHTAEQSKETWGQIELGIKNAREKAHRALAMVREQHGFA